MDPLNEEEFAALPKAAKEAIAATLSEKGKAAVAYARMGWQVFPCKANKRPDTPNGYKDAHDDVEYITWYWSQYPDENIGICTGVASGFIVIDVDVNDIGTKWGDVSLEEWEKANNCKLPETVTAVTGHGGQHLFYRTDSKFQTSVNNTLCIDVKAEGGYIIGAESTNEDGGLYFWDIDPFENEMAPVDNTVLAFLAYQGTFNESSQGTGGNVLADVPDVINDGEGREMWLLKYAYSLRAHGYERTQLEVELAKFNQEKCKPPKLARDIKRIAKSACKKPAGLSPEYQAAKERAEARKAMEAEAAAAAFEAEQGSESDEPTECVQPIDPAMFTNKRGALLHNIVGQDMIVRYHARKIDGVPALWIDDHYECGWDVITRHIFDYKNGCKESERREVIKWLDSMLPKVTQDNPYLVAFTNCTVDARTLKICPSSYADNIPNTIPHEYHENAYSELLTDTLLGIASCDMDTLENMFEMIGMCMVRDSKRGKAFFIIENSGSNGKSTFLNFLRYVIGENNYSSLDPQDFGAKFQSTVLMGKLANIADDIPADFADNKSMSVLKKTVLGDVTGYEIKGGATGYFTPYCTNIFTMNKMPALGDGTGGMMRRIHPVSFHAHFTKDTGEDLDRGAKLQTEECAQAAIACGMASVHHVIEVGGVTETPFSMEQRHEILIANNQVVAFLENEAITADYVNNMGTKELYDQFRQYCESTGVTHIMGMNKFVPEVCTQLNVGKWRNQTRTNTVFYKKLTSSDKQ